jgi:hypothetical protein
MTLGLCIVSPRIGKTQALAWILNLGNDIF